MKNCWLLIFIVFFYSCSSFKIELAEYQNVFPGVESVEPYERIEIDIDSKSEIMLDSVLINIKGLCGKMHFEIVQNGNTVQQDSLISGKFQIISGKLENNVIDKDIVSCVLKEGTAKIYYKVKGVSKIKSVPSFSNVRKYQR
ncbi:hypothetical protein [Aureivirga sp. CE67]|uniref:hypothetical protein n=1 Tax=Aureivirga sp. CE67 TaxID=1788983 RepID=UPI0018CAF92A|nr:hypothetical protein [Aureivirga sp. CE67]